MLHVVRHTGRPRSAAAIAFAVLLSGLAAGEASAQEWTQVYPGIDYLERRTGPDVFAVRVDLERDDLRLRATRSEHRGRTTSSFASTYGCEVAVNADFFSFEDYSTLGLAVGTGEAWAGSADPDSHGFLAAGAGNRVEIPHTGDVVDPPEPWMAEVVGGNPLLVWEGEPITHDCGNFCGLHPRTAAGLSEDGEELYLVVVDGRSEASAGMTLTDLGVLMHDLGSYRALNLDGGGSSTMFVEGLGGVVNAPSGGAQRVVANHLGVCLGGAYGDVTGFVREGDIYDDSAGVAGARVELSSGAVATTDDSGRYTVERVPAGDTLIAATAPGFAGEREIHVVSDNLTWGSIALEPSPDAGAPQPPDAGAPQRPDAAPPVFGPDGGPGGGGASDGGQSGGCATHAGGTGAGAGAMAALVVALAWRRRPPRRDPASA